MQNYDIIIIGGGISGLYSAYKILKINPKTSILILEKFKKKWFGGRLGNHMFGGVSVVTGAGIGRKGKDYLLINLLKELKIPFNEYEVEHLYARTITNKCNVKNEIENLKREYKQRQSDEHISFKDFALPIMGNNLYKKFVICSGYTDYEKADAKDTLYNYGFDDNYTSYTGLHIPWKNLIDVISYKIGMDRIKTSSKVISIEKNPSNRFLIHTENGITYSCDKVIVATTISSVLKLVPGAENKDSIYQQIHGQPFLRLYGKFSKASIPIMQRYAPHMTMVPSVLQKIIPIDADKGVYMIAYSDNANAIALKDHLKNTSENRLLYCELIEKSLGIPSGTIHLTSILDFYWPIGTHYYEPLKGPFKTRNEFIRKAQHPMPGMLVVGEMISNDQGWTQGALDSVEKVITKKWVEE